MKKKKISVIISVYNTANYIKKCLDSILNQTYKNLEIILIEDGSTDNSVEILKKYEKKDSRIVLIINEKNMGLAASRNKGLARATGDYIGFIDSDDYIPLNYYETLIKAIEKEHADVAICDINLIFENEKTEILRKCCEGEWNIVNIIDNGMVASACNKLFKAELIKKYSFAVGKINEDIAVVIPTLIHAKKISYANCTYNYVQRNNSIQNSAFSMKRFDIIDAVDTTLERIQDCEHYEDIKDAIIFNQIIVLLFYVIPKDKRFFYRQKAIKKFNELTTKYDIRQNKCYWKFADCSGKKHAMYYRLLLKFVCTGHYFLANLLFIAYKILSKILKGKPVIKKNLTINDLITVAKKQQSRKEKAIKISVVIPNYNYEKFLKIPSLKEELDNRAILDLCILYQNVKIYELIILDDCSKDNSRILIDEIVDKLSPYIKIKKVYNESNSGSAFKQWQKGFDLATGDYVWIAEADDYCQRKLLYYLLKPIQKDKNVKICYSDTAFIDALGYKTMKSIKPQIDIMNTKHWDTSYINSGQDEIKNYTFLNCTIANVSSCIIKKDNYNDYLSQAGKFKQAGDWYFYVNVMKHGNIAYINKVLNYYRMHGNNVSNIMDHQKHLEEIQKIYDK